MRVQFLIYIFGVFLIALFSQCEVDEPIHFVERDMFYVPQGFPDVLFPEENQLTEARWELGKKLFFDPIMSENLSVSCASCHLPALAFSDEEALSEGVDGLLTNRNSPSLGNVAYHPYFTREGGVPTLEQQILVPIQEHNEFNTNILTIAERMNAKTDYINMSQQAYDRDPDPFVITRSIATFERTLLSGDSAYDQSERGEYVLSESAQRGKELFFSTRSNCSQCHGGFNFTNYAFENNGLYEIYEDEGRFRLTGEAADLEKFKVPSLRNIGLTAPYMHDGKMSDLKEVLDHYNNGGQSNAQKSALIVPLNLDDAELQDLENFLLALTDQAFIQNQLFHED